MKYEIAYDMCHGCFAKGAVCNPSPRTWFNPCPKLSGELEKLIKEKARELGIPREKDVVRREMVLLNPDDYPAYVSGDGQSRMPMFPKWGTRIGHRYQKRSLEELCAEIKETLQMWPETAAGEEKNK